MHADTMRASCYAAACRDIHVKLPPEDQEPGEEHLCGKLVQVMYGTRDAAQSWQTICPEIDTELGSSTGKSWSCHLYYGTWQVCGIVPGDDFVPAGRKDYLKKSSEYMATKVKIKVGLSLMGQDETNVLRVLSIVSRSIKWTQQRLECESDHWHAVKLIGELGLRRNHELVTPAILEPRTARQKEVDIQTSDGIGVLGKPVRADGTPAGGSARPRSRAPSLARAALARGLTPRPIPRKPVRAG